jgi:hypothetical protein
MNLNWHLTKQFFRYWFVAVFLSPQDHKLAFIICLDATAKMLTEEMSKESRERVA